MKLIDILARELKEWPAGVESLSQLKGTGYIINGKGFDGRAFDSMQLADETRIAGAIVTRAQWQAAVDALKADECEHSYGNEKGCPECGEEFERRWNGEGIPPTGTDCEAKVKNSGAGWKTYKVLAVASEYLIASCDAEEIPIRHQYWDLRPIRTAEQIAAEKYESEAADLAEVMTGHRDRSKDSYLTLAKLILDAGYRKQVAQ